MTQVAPAAPPMLTVIVRSVVVLVGALVTAGVFVLVIAKIMEPGWLLVTAFAAVATIEVGRLLFPILAREMPPVPLSAALQPMGLLLVAAGLLLNLVIGPPAHILGILLLGQGGLVLTIALAAWIAAFVQRRRRRAARERTGSSG